ncbi:response regulator [Saccharophagus sp. K07]|jgi:two-component system response regulator|uniref:response regulator n=1 Tax=Saccharophagus sp. K07 TaxID=2283636 RepID=UPI0016522C5B|nr:response regulator [Saccharophagus sp. K07]MBC6904922.1 response regulator [Saccharophagus sp. K07]
MDEHRLILIVEDNPDHAELLEATIQDCSSEIAIDIQKNGEDALHYLRTSATLPSVVLMDLKMPRMNGIETLIAIKQDAALKHIPVVMLSTSTNESEMRICLKSGAEMYLSKPLQASVFEELILPLLDRRLKSALPKNVY